MAHTFAVKLSGPITSVLAHVESEITTNGGSFEGDAERGLFSGKTPLGYIVGEYRSASDAEINVTITEKPFLVPYSVIEAKIREYFC